MVVPRPETVPLFRAETAQAVVLLRKDEAVTFIVVGWRNPESETSEEDRYETHDWQLAGARVAYMLKTGFRMVIVDDLARYAE